VALHEAIRSQVCLTELNALVLSVFVFLRSLSLYMPASVFSRMCSPGMPNVFSRCAFH